MDGYYYSIAYNPSGDYVAQFSYVFYSTCSDATLKSKLDDYISINHYQAGRNEGPFATTDEAENNRKDAKNEWKDSGYNIGGDNNFFGNCTE